MSVPMDDTDRVVAQAYRIAEENERLRELVRLLPDPPLWPEDVPSLPPAMRRLVTAEVARWEARPELLDLWREVTDRG